MAHALSTAMALGLFVGIGTPPKDRRARQAGSQVGDVLDGLCTFARREFFSLTVRGHSGLVTRPNAPSTKAGDVSLWPAENKIDGSGGENI